MQSFRADVLFDVHIAHDACNDEAAEEAAKVLKTYILIGQDQMC